MSNFTQEQWRLLASTGASEAMPLHQVDMNRSFVYLRDIGVFYCSPGKHRLAMSLLLAFAHGHDNAIEAAEALGLDFPEETADRWLEETPGAAFRSSVGGKVQAGKREHLSMIERRWLGNIDYLFEV
jgi:hypothetical protein